MASLVFKMTRRLIPSKGEFTSDDGYKLNVLPLLLVYVNSDVELLLRKTSISRRGVRGLAARPRLQLPGSKAGRSSPPRHGNRGTK